MLDPPDHDAICIVFNRWWPAIMSGKHQAKKLRLIPGKSDIGLALCKQGPLGIRLLVCGQQYFAKHLETMHGYSGQKSLFVSKMSVGRHG